MIKHIVLWRLKDSASGRSKKENAILLREKLLSMKDKVSGIINIEVGFDFSNETESSDIVLYSEFESLEALQKYQAHPEHQAIKQWLSEVRYERRVIDYEV